MLAEEEKVSFVLRSVAVEEESVLGRDRLCQGAFRRAVKWIVRVLREGFPQSWSVLFLAINRQSELASGESPFTAIQFQSKSEFRQLA